GLDLAVEAAHRGGGEHAFGRAPGPHHRVHSGPHHGGGDPGREVAVTNKADARARFSDIGDEPFVTRTVEHDHHEVVHLAVERLGDDLQVVLDGGVDVDL